MSKLQESIRLIEQTAEQDDSIIIMCSLGKDSLVALDLCYGRFKRIICVFMYFVKGLDHVQKWINWLKARYPDVEFVQIPHWNLSHILHYGLYCVANPNVRLFRLADTVKALRLRFGISTVVLGMKKADSMNRRLMLMTLQDKEYKHLGMFYPLADWTQKEILSYMRLHRLPEPVRYSLKASSGIGFDTDCFVWMEKNYPQDLEKIYKVFPLSRRILFEYHRKEEESTMKHHEEHNE